MWAPLVLVAIPIIEIALFVIVGSEIGVWSTIGLVALAFVVGLSILRSNGARSLPQIQAALQRGEDPGQQMFAATLRMMGGGLLLLPGFLSDIIGIALLLPPVQQLVYAKAKTRFKAAAAQQGGFGASFGGSGFSAGGFSAGGFQGFGGQGFSAGFGQGFGKPHGDDDVIDVDFEDVTRADSDKRLTGPASRPEN